jgi:hypothetical protein
MNHDPFVLRSDACLAMLLSKNLQTGTLMLLVYGGVAAAIVATVVRLITPSH